MSLFVISWMDKPDSLPLRLATRPDHLAFLAAAEDMVKLGGPYLNAAGDPIGSMMIVEAPDLETAQTFHGQDPYKAAGLYETSTVTPWRVAVGGLG